jgi:MoxR-like ATPase
MSHKKINLGTATFKEFVGLMKIDGYHPTDLSTLKVTLSQLRDMHDGPEYEGNIVGLIADGKPGTGKSWLAQCVARVLDAEYIFYNCHPDSSQEELISEPNAGAVVNSFQQLVALLENMSQRTTTGGPAKPPADKIVDVSKLSRAELYNMGQLLQAIIQSDQKPVVLLIDELDKGRTAVDATLLTIMSEGMVYLQGWGEDGEVLAIRANRRNLFVVIAKNQNRELEEALYRRFPTVWINYPPRSVEIEMLMDSTGVGPSVAKHLVRMARKIRASDSVRKEPSFPELKRLALDFKKIWERDCVVLDDKKRIQCGVSRVTLFNEVVSTLQARPKERLTTLEVLGVKRKNQKKIPQFLGTQLLAKFAEDAGKQYKISCATEQSIRSGM